MNAFTKADVVAEYVKKFPDAPKLTLARRIFKDEPGLFETIEHARNVIRKVRGCHGVSARKDYARFSPLFKSDIKDVPVGEVDDWTPVELNPGRFLCLFDMHMPYHNTEAVLAALEYGHNFGIDGLIIQEALDCYQLSTFAKDPRKRSMQDEINQLNDMLYLIKKRTKVKEIYYQLGNHEDRLEKYLCQHAVAVLGMDFAKWENIIDRSLGIKIVSGQRVIKAGGLNIVHGHEFGSGVFEPVNPSRGLFLRGHEHCLAGHWHRTSSHTETSMNGDVISSWTLGCLCDLHPGYRRINKWNHGFGIVELKKSGNFMVHNKRIINGEVFSA